MKWSLFLLLISGCALQEDRECLEYETRVHEHKRCFGQFDSRNAGGPQMCETVPITKLICKEYKEENASKIQAK